MSLVNDELSVWEIGFRWAGFDARSWRVRLPLLVCDNFRLLMDAILNCHLRCETLSAEKYQGNDKDETRFYIRYWLEDVYACIEGRKFNRELLKWALIGRTEFADWCERRKIPLPEFWFPSGWAMEYDWRQESLIDGGQALSSEPEVEGESDDQGSSNKLRTVQRRTIAAQVVAGSLWAANPETTIADMVKSEIIQELCGAKYYGEEAVRRWLQKVAPPEVSAKKGRPPKKK